MEDVFDGVMALKQEFEQLFGKQPLSKSKPHITIASFKMNSKYQDFLIEVLGQLSQRQPFKLSIRGFGVFDSSRTLYLEVSKNEAIKAIHEEVRQLHGAHLKGKLKAFTVSDDPHITISKTKGKKMLYESLQHFQKEGYSKQIEVDHLTLVSRTKYRPWDWEHKIRLS